MQLQLDNNKKELKSHGTYAFPVNVSYEQLSRYERKSFLWHWHKEIELTILLQGEMQYQVNDTIYHLQAGEGLSATATVCIPVLPVMIPIVSIFPQPFIPAFFTDMKTA